MYPIVIFQKNYFCCFSCQRSNYKNINFNWEYRPRLKDLVRGHKIEMLILQIKLCDICYYYCINKSYYYDEQILSGHDTWDAIDGLNFPSQEKINKYYDKMKIITDIILI